MKQIIYKLSALLLGIFLTGIISAQEHHIIKFTVADEFYPSIVLVQLDNDSVLHEEHLFRSKSEKTPIDGKFVYSIPAPKGSYALIADYEGPFYKPTCIAVEIKNSDVDLGEIQIDPVIEFLPGSFSRPISFVKTDEEDGVKVRQFILSPFGKRYNMLNYLTHIELYQYRTEKQTSHTAIFVLDYKLLEMSVLELDDMFRNMTAKDIIYVSLYSPSEEYPGGKVLIVTEASFDERTHRPSAF